MVALSVLVILATPGVASAMGEGSGLPDELANFPDVDGSRAAYRNTLCSVVRAANSHGGLDADGRMCLAASLAKIYAAAGAAVARTAEHRRAFQIQVDQADALARRYCNTPGGRRGVESLNASNAALKAKTAVHREWAGHIGIAMRTGFPGQVPRPGCCATPQQYHAATAVAGGAVVWEALTLCSVAAPAWLQAALGLAPVAAQ